MHFGKSDIKEERLTVLFVIQPVNDFRTDILTCLLYTSSEHRLNLTVPQAYINELERGYVPPESWDRGIDVFYTSYNLSQYRSYDSNNNSNTASYGRFNSGLNLFSWQLHSDASYSKPDDMKGKWQSNTLYLERGWSQILSTVQIGEKMCIRDRKRGLRYYGSCWQSAAGRDSPDLVHVPEKIIHRRH